MVLDDLHVDDRLLEARGEIGQVDVAAGRPLLLHVAEHGGLQPAHREVAVAGVRHRAREADRVRVAVARHRVERGPAGEPEAQQPRHLVERLARGVVERLAQDLVAMQPRACARASCVRRRRSAPRTAARGARARGSSPSSAPSRWFTPTRSAPVARATPLAAAMPTSRAPTRPGPTVTATASMSPKPDLGLAERLVHQRVQAPRHGRAPPPPAPRHRSVRAGGPGRRSGWLAIVKPSSTTATAVSSQEVSMPRVITRGARASGSSAAIALEPPRVVGRPDVVGPHDQARPR